MYIVYKVTNLINSKTYIGVHKTTNLDDGYMGSGILIKKAIRKHGKINFKKDVLLVTEDKDEAYAKEIELTVDFDKPNNYNMRIGGVGGFTKSDAAKGRIVQCRNAGLSAKRQKTGVHSLTSEEHKAYGRLGGLANKGKPKSEAHVQKIRDAWIKKKQGKLNGETSGS